MSRIVVKNLPKQISQEELKKHFSKKGSITDVRLIYKNGEFRRYAFIGFEDEGDAVAACDYFHNTFIRQAKMAVELCQELGKGQKPKSWAEKNKKNKEEKAKLKNAATNNNKTETEKEGKKKKKERKKEESSLNEKLLDQYKDDPTFGEFLKANEKGAREESSTAVITKEEESSSEAAGEEEQEEKEEENEDKLAQKKNISDQDYLKSLMKATPQDKDHIEGTKPRKKKERKEFHTVVIRATEMCKAKESNSRTFTKKSVKAFLKPLRFKSLRIPKNVRMVAYVGFRTEKEMKQALQKDKSFLDGVRVHIVKHEKPSNGGNNNTQSNTPWSVKEEALKNAEPVAESGKLFVRNLWYSVTEELLQELFQKYGEVTDVTLPICKYTRQAKGFATITFMFPEHAVRAMSELDGTSFKGRILHILPAVEPKTENKQKENMSFKEKKAQEKKATAGSWHNWNTLFMGTGAVVDIMAERYNRSKQEILDSEGKQSVAVNLALGETQVVDETKRFLEDNGVSLEAFSTPGVQRSKTVFLVKNLPAKTMAQELVDLFCKFGELGRVILPPSGVTGIVEFLDSGEAKKAFRNLAYSRFKSIPLYLEWAPVQVFKTEFTAKTEEIEDEEAEVSEDKSIKEEKAPAVTQHDPEPDTTVYVKNLNFSTTEEVLRQHFERIGTICSVLIARRRGESQGYGFVQFLRRADAQKALREMNESTLEDHTLQIKLSEKTLVTTLKSARRIHDAGKQTSSKILVKNIPFQATPKEVRQLFVTFGELKSVRLPQKPGSNEHRGFGFVDFVSKEDAKKAFEALGLSTHLYDRRLVLEWAKDEETVDELRKRTAEHFLGAGPSKKRSKVQVDAKMKDDSDDD